MISLVTSRSDDIGQPVGAFRIKSQQHLKETPMKKLFLAIALVVAFAAPAIAAPGGQFPNPYATNADARGY
jgi:hypothetical protein